MADKEYVDKESLARHIENSFSEISTPFHVSAIRNFPAADNVVEVVRCKYCKYWIDQEFQGFCSVNNLSRRHANDFCSYGKREEEKVLSERQEKRKRQIQRMRHSMAVDQWHLEEPFPLLVWRWIKWKRSKPKLEDFKVKE